MSVLSVCKFQVVDKTCQSPTQLLEQHMMWDDIAILARYLLMLSFNNCLDVARHLPYLFHTVTFLVCSGSLSMRASTHGLVINIIHSLCTCTKPSFSGENNTSMPSLHIIILKYIIFYRRNTASPAFIPRRVFLAQVLFIVWY